MIIVMNHGLGRKPEGEMGMQTERGGRA